MVQNRLKLRIIINSTPPLEFFEGEFSRTKEKSNMVRIPTNGPPTHPGEMLLEEFLKPLGMSQAELAGKLCVSYPRINELIHGKRGVTPDTALRLEQLFGMEAQFWLNLQLTWDLYQLIHSPAVKRIRRIKRLPALEARAVR
jgi:addiction module HigA family antidote